MSQNDEFSKNFNFLLKVMQDFVNNTKNYSQIDYSKINAEFIKAANATGLSNKEALKLINSSINKIGMPGKNTDEFKKAVETMMNGGIDRLGRIMDPDQFLKNMNEFFVRVKTLPINLNNKENISIISKAIARGNRDYASTGMGKKTAEFYKNATDKQIIALANIRKEIKEGTTLKNDNSTKGFLTSLLKGAAMGVGGVADILMENAGFGQLPGKFVDMLSAGKDVFKSMKKDKVNAEEERNAFLLDSAKMSQASLLEISERNKKNKDIIDNTESRKNDLKNDMAKVLEEALNSTQFGKKKKENIMAEFNNGTLDNKRLVEISKSWMAKLGPNISKENQEIINKFNTSMNSGITDLNDIDKILDQMREKYKEGINKELESVNTVFKNKELVDDLIEKTLLENKKIRDKQMKKKMGSGYTKEVEDMLDKEDAYKVRKQYQIGDSEDLGLYADIKQKLKDAEKNKIMANSKGKSDKDIENEIAEMERDFDKKYEPLLTNIEKEKVRLSKISRIYDSEDTVFTDAEKKAPNLKFKTISATPIINTTTPKVRVKRNRINNKTILAQSTLNNVQNVPTTQNNPATQSQLSNQNTQKQQQTSSNKNQNLPQNRGNGLVKLDKNSEYMKKHYDLVKKIYGEDGNKFAKNIATHVANMVLNVKVTNFPSGGSSSPKGKTTTPPDTNP